MPLYALDEHEPSLPEDGSVFIAPDAHVIGRVRLGAEVGVWFGAVLRGDAEEITVGARTNIQDGAMLHADPGVPLVIGSGVTIGHHAIVHGCTIADDVLIGMGATILNGARIGRGSIVGANALVTEGKSFAAGSLVIGSPARAVRELTEAEKAGLRLSAGHYVENAKRFAKGLRRLD